jgi:hypothetical protein
MVTEAEVSLSKTDDVENWFTQPWLRFHRLQLHCYIFSLYLCIACLNSKTVTDKDDLSKVGQLGGD